jgi:hypothetical protein
MERLGGGRDVLRKGGRVGKGGEVGTGGRSKPLKRRKQLLAEK